MEIFQINVVCHRQEQVRVQLPTSADNVTLPAFTAERRCAVGRHDRYLLPAGPTAANLSPHRHASASMM